MSLVTRHSPLILVLLLSIPASAVGQPEDGRLEVAVSLSRRSSGLLAEPRLGDIQARIGVNRAFVFGVRGSYFLTRRTVVELIGDLSQTRAFAAATDPLTGSTLRSEGTRITVIGYQVGVAQHIAGRRVIPFITAGLGGLTYDQTTDIISDERFPLRTRLTCGLGAGVTLFLHQLVTVRGEVRDRLAVWGSRGIPLHNIEPSLSVVVLLAGVEP